MAQAAIIDKCDLCDSQDNVNFFCTVCEEILCSNCKLAHEKSKKTRNDIILTLSQARQDNIAHKSTTVFCIEHSSIEVTLFCFKCNQLVCTQCLAGKHKRHQVTRPDEIRDSKEEELKTVINSLKETKVIFENAFDIESKVHSQFSKSIEQVKKEITGQKAKIVEELDIICEEQFSEMKLLQQNEDRRYSDACSKIHEQNQSLTTAIETAQVNLTSINTSVIIKATADALQTLQGIEEPTIPPTRVATYQPGDASIRQVKGKVNIEQTTCTNQLDDSVSKIRDRINILQGTKRKQKTDTHKVDTQEQKTNDDNKGRHEDNKPRIDLKKLRAKSSVKIKGKGTIYTIIPLQDKTAWIQADNDTHLTLIDSTGKILTKSASLGNRVFDAKEYKNELLVTCWHTSKMCTISSDKKSGSIFSELSPYQPRGLCITQDAEVLVCLHSLTDDKDNRVVRLGSAGNVIQTIKYDTTGTPLYDNPAWSVTSLTTGEVVVVDGDMIVGVDREGRYLFTWEGEMQGKKLHKYSVSRITHDSNNNLLVTDYMNHRVFVLGKDGSEAMCLLDKTRKIYEPWGIAVDNTGLLWVGCYGGIINFVEY